MNLFAAPQPDAYILYGAECSMFSAKLRSYLRWKRVPYGEVNPSLKVYRDVIVPRTGVRYIPVLQTPGGRFLQDTAVIIDELEQRIPERPLQAPGPRQRLASELLSLFGDEWLVIWAMHYRWSFPESNQPFLNRTFGSVAFPNWPRWLRGILGARVAKKFAGMLKPLGVNHETIPALHSAFLALLGDLEAHLSQHTFLLGERASLADFSWAGAFLAHLAHDPHPTGLLNERAPAVLAWAERMRQPGNEAGAWAENDEIPVSALPLLNRVAAQQLPVLADAAGMLDEWAAGQRPGAPVPRSLGLHTVPVCGVRTQRAATSYPLWRLQRIRDGWCVLEGSDRAAADRLLDGIGALPYFLRPPATRLERHDNRLYLAGADPSIS